MISNSVIACTIPATGVRPPFFTFVAVRAMAPVAGIPPKIDEKIWQKTQETCHEKDEKNQYDFCFQTFTKKTSV